MRLKRTIRLTTSMLATTSQVGALLILMASAVPLAAQQVVVQPNDVRKQLNQPAQAKPVAPPQVQSQPKPAPAVPNSPARPAQAKAQNPATAVQATAKPAATTQAVAKPATAAQATAKPTTATQTAAKPAPTTNSVAPQNLATQTSASAEDAKPEPPHENIARRDPFSPLVDKEKAGPAPESLPPGKNGLQINTVRLDGIVRGPNGTIAVVSNPQQRVYFLREGDRVYDGQVSHITADAISFHESGQDPFGKTVEREVTKRLYPSPGEQQ
jgi:Tfp pilus assembly protein PilP